MTAAARTLADIALPSYADVEAAAKRIAGVALGFAAVETVDVTVHKPDAPITVPFADVSVSIRRSRAAGGDA